MDNEEIELTPEERKAIRALQRLAKSWPKTLWLFSASGTLNVMRYGPNGEHAENYAGGVDQSHVVTTVDIDNDGGDW